MEACSSHLATFFSRPPAEGTRPKTRGHQGLGHVYLAGPPLEFDSTGVRCLTYDDASQTLAVVRNEECLLYSLKIARPQGPAGGPPLPMEIGEPQVLPLSDGEVLGVRASPTLPVVAVHRSSARVEFVDRNSGSSFIQGPRRGRSNMPLLGFFWVQSSATSFCFVTPQGLELYHVSPNHSSLTYIKTLVHQIRWYCYTHESRMVILGTGDRGTFLAAYQFATEEVIKLPPFELSPYAAPGAQKPSLETNQVRLLTLYGRVYCCHMDPDGARLTFYRFYRDAVVLQHEVELIGGPVELSTYDNLVLVHHLQTGVVLLVDVGQGGRRLAPVASPLPLALHMPPEHCQGGARFSPDAAVNSLLPDYEVYCEDWQFHPPGIVIDVRNGLVWRLEVFLEGLVATCSTWPQLAGLLQRRRALYHPLSPPKPLLLGLIAALLQEREPMAVVSTVYDALSSATAMQLKIVAQQGARVQMEGGAATPTEVTREVLRWLHEEEAVDAAYLTAAVMEYIASVEAAGLAVPPELFCLAVDCMLEQGQVSQIATMVEWQPSCGSVELADHLERLAAAGKLSSGWDLAGVILSRKGAHQRLCKTLLARGRVLAALRHCHRHRVVGVPPKAFLDAAVSLGDSAVFTTVYRFCQEHIPDSFAPYEELYSRYLDADIGKAPAAQACP